ncbi:glycoside hydrolase family 1 protein [Rhodococcus chondri]|uniref:Family 1 glycosylhydrolase n=1 Tax=Rhodococcus chondri TaxID=3065941 RepID=A0ABU7JZD6_9NOCA|nr:family 1 glycosylhydrolase [Rhodococcus sp. CC-R104]MEE2035374.1 family 1 glycosylhydrolase [Rhodococcus sp. CC-R104]
MKAALATLALVVAAAGAVPAHAAPYEFLWGVSSSGFQSEGSSPDSNWSRYANSPDHEPIGAAVDFRHRYREDIALAAGLGVEVYRISIEWARIQPSPGSWDDAELAYYDDVIATIRVHGMTPMLTLDHWVYPGWIADRGGWTYPGIVDAWLEHAEKVAARYAGLDALWVTINEPTAYVWQEVSNGGLAPSDTPQMFDRLVRAHRGAYTLIHRHDPGARVTSNAAYVPGAQPHLDAWFLDRVRDTLDYVGVDYYYGIAPDNLTAVHAVTGDYASIVPRPEGMHEALMDYTHRYPGLPLYVVENGMPTADAAPRADGWTRSRHLREHVDAMGRAIADGAPVFGYNYWSITDNYEWGSYSQRFGLYTVDVRTDPGLHRHPTDAVATYREIVAGTRFR